MLAEKSRVHVVRDRPLKGSISSYFSSSLKKLNYCSLSTHDSDMMLYPELFIRSCTWLSPKAQHTGIWYIARSFPRFSAPFKTPGNHNVDAKQCQKQLSPRASPICPATMHGQKNALKQIPTFSKQPQRPLDQSLILKFSDHCSKVSFSSQTWWCYASRQQAVTGWILFITCVAPRQYKQYFSLVGQMNQTTC